MGFFHKYITYNYKYINDNFLDIFQILITMLGAVCKECPQQYLIFEKDVASGNITFKTLCVWKIIYINIILLKLHDVI